MVVPPAMHLNVVAVFAIHARRHRLMAPSEIWQPNIYASIVGWLPIDEAKFLANESSMFFAYFPIPLLSKFEKPVLLQSACRAAAILPRLGFEPIEDRPEISTHHARLLLWHVTIVVQISLNITVW